MDLNKEAILKLKDGESYVVPESDYGRAEIWPKNERYFLFSIPSFGGTPQFEEHFRATSSGVNQMINLYESWT